MAVTFGTCSTKSYFGSTTLSHAVDAGTDHLLVFAANSQSTVPGTVTVNASAMTQLYTISSGSRNVTAWYHASPSTGAATIAITPPTTAECVAFAVDVLGSTAFGTQYSSVAQSSITALSMSTAASVVVISMAAWADPSTAGYAYSSIGTTGLNSETTLAKNVKESNAKGRLTGIIGQKTLTSGAENTSFQLSSGGNFFNLSLAFGILAPAAAVSGGTASWWY